MKRAKQKWGKDRYLDLAARETLECADMLIEHFRLMSRETTDKMYRLERPEKRIEIV